MAVHFDEEDGLRVAGKADLHIVLDEVDGHVVHEFQRTGQDVGGDDAGHGFGSFCTLSNTAIMAWRLAAGARA